MEVVRTLGSGVLEHIARIESEACSGGGQRSVKSRQVQLIDMDHGED
jgi:hypothetical protein